MRAEQVWRWGAPHLPGWIPQGVPRIPCRTALFSLPGQTIPPISEPVSRRPREKWNYLNTLTVHAAGGQWVSRRFAALLREHGLRRITLHAVRHSYASALVEQGERIVNISRRLGHSSTRVTEDLYVGVREEVDEDLADRSSGFLWGES